jgi:hypothetical protein
MHIGEHPERERRLAAGECAWRRRKHPLRSKRKRARKPADEEPTCRKHLKTILSNAGFLLLLELILAHSADRAGPIIWQFLERNVVWIHNAPLRGMRRAVKKQKKSRSYVI